MFKGNMNFFKNDTASFYSPETLLPYIEKLCLLSREHPSTMEGFKGANDEVKEFFREEGFDCYNTVEKTTVLYSQKTGCFFKILHPLKLRNKLVFFLSDKAGHFHALSECLSGQGIKVPRVEAYGTFRKGRRPFFVIRKVDGESLYDVLIRQRRAMALEIYMSVINEVARLHRTGYWLGDAHLSHVFIKDAEVSGFIDIDSIRSNGFFILRKFAKDIAGLNHPQLPLTEDEKKSLLGYYLKLSGIKKKEKFLRLLKYYTERRWKGQA